MLTKIYEQNPSERELRKVVDALEDGGIIIYPKMCIRDRC